MDFLNNIYHKSLEENQKNLNFWTDYLKQLNELNFGVYSEKLKVPILVPIGSRILFRGEIKHTNEVTVALGADYFTKCSIVQAEVLRKHRIKDATSKIETLTKEKEYLLDQLSFGNENIFDRQGQEIVEYHTEEEDRAWRQKHRENMRNYKRNKNQDEDFKTDVTDEELWERLEELELQEELQSELDKTSKPREDSHKDAPLIKEQSSYTPVLEKIEGDATINNTVKDKIPTVGSGDSRYELLKQIMDKQQELENKLYDLKTKEHKKSTTESDLIEKLNEIEELEELEDEIDRIEDIIENEKLEDSGDLKTEPKLMRRVSFADEDSETLEITFKHSDVEPNSDPFDPDKGITKPSDVYKMYGQSTPLKSLLKKTKYPITDSYYSKEDTNIVENLEDDIEVPVQNRTIVIKDVIEKVNTNENITETSSRPTSLFKLRRQQKK